MHPEQHLSGSEVRRASSKFRLGTANCPLALVG
jgi:hypothetical protein